MTKHRAIRRLVLLSAGLICCNSYAQTQSPALIDFVNNPANGATELQKTIGEAVQIMCAGLASQGGFQFSQPAGQELFARCNELVSTAQGFNIGDPDSPERSLGYTNPDELLAALQQVWGEELHANQDLTARVTSGQFANIAGRLNALRVGAASAGLGGRLAATNPYEAEPVSVANRQFALTNEPLTGGGAAGDADIAGSRWGWFLEGSYNTGDRDQTVNENAFDFDAGSFTAGFDYLLDAGVVGISVGVDQFDASFDNTGVVTGGDVELESTSTSLFAAWFGEKFHFDGILSFGTIDNESSRRVVYDSTDMCIPACPPQNRTLTGDTDGDYTSVGASAGYEINRGNWDFNTTLSLSYRDISIDGFDEVDSDPLGGLALRYSEQSIESLRSIVGFSATGYFSQSFGILSPQFRIEWHHEFEDDPVLLRAKYIVEDLLGTVPPGDFTGASCLSCATFASDQIDTDFGIIGIGLSAVFSRRIQIYGVYDALIGMDDMTSNAFSLGLRGQF